MFNSTGLTDGQAIKVQFNALDNIKDSVVRSCVGYLGSIADFPVDAVYYKAGSIDPNGDVCMNDTVCVYLPVEDYYGAMWPHEDGADYTLVE